MNLAELMQTRPSEEPYVFVGETVTYGNVGIYGGHFLGQALASAFHTVPEDKRASSFHAYFLKGGHPGEPIIYRVDRLREGRGFDNRVVTAIQGGEAVFQMNAAFKIAEEGDEHGKPMPEVPGPAEAREAREAGGSDQPDFPMTREGRVEMELISDTFIPREFKAGREPRLQNWMRVPDASGLDQRSQQCLLAYLADGTLMFNSVLPYGTPFQTHRLTSLDQSVWFHHPCDAGSWLLYDQRSTVAADGRGLNEGEVFDEQGRHVMSTAQESMLRRIARD